MVCCETRSQIPNTSSTTCDESSGTRMFAAKSNHNPAAWRDESTRLARFSNGILSTVVVALISTVASCSGGGEPKTSPPPPVPDFTLTISPVSASAVVGNTTSKVTVSVEPKTASLVPFRSLCKDCPVVQVRSQALLFPWQQVPARISSFRSLPQRRSGFLKSVSKVLLEAIHTRRSLS